MFDTPIKLFYSRRIGKRLYTGKEVSIIGGVKYTGSYQRLKFGFLSAYTDEASTEPKGLYSVGRIKLGVLENSDIGVLYSEARNEDNTQGVLGIDGTFRTREIQIMSQVAKERGYAELLKLDWNARKFIVQSKYENYDENFNIDRIGYAPWKGRTNYSLGVGPRFFNIGPFYSLSTGIGRGAIKDVGEPDWGYWISTWFYSTFKNNCGLSSDFYKGRSYEIDRWYEYYQASVSFWSDNSKPVVLSDNGEHRVRSSNFILL
ncbi:MAG: hypothetical protein ACP5EQ_04195 [Candidatus Cloacimonadia bacterium]